MGQYFPSRRVMLDIFSRASRLSILNERWQAGIEDGRGVGDAASKFRVSSQTVYAWLGLYEDHGLECLSLSASP